MKLQEMNLITLIERREFRACVNRMEAKNYSNDSETILPEILEFNGDGMNSIHLLAARKGYNKNEEQVIKELFNCFLKIIDTSDLKYLDTNASPPAISFIYDENDQDIAKEFNDEINDGDRQEEEEGEESEEEQASQEEEQGEESEEEEGETIPGQRLSPMSPISLAVENSNSHFLRLMLCEPHIFKIRRSTYFFIKNSGIRSLLDYYLSLKMKKVDRRSRVSFSGFSW